MNGTGPEVSAPPEDAKGGREETAPARGWAGALPAALVLVVGFVLTLGVWDRGSDSADAVMRQRFQYHTDRIIRDMRVALETEEHLLRAVAGLYRAEPGIDRTGWRTFFSSLSTAAPGSARLWIGYAPTVPSAAIGRYERQERAEGMSGYTVRSGTGGPLVYPLEYARSFGQAVTPPLGQDLQDDPALRQAMQRADATRDMVMTGPLTAPGLAQPGAVVLALVIPHLHDIRDPTRREGVRTEVRGFLLTVFDAMQVAAGALGPDGAVIGMNVSDLGSPVFACTELKAALASGFRPELVRDVKLDFAAHRWDVHLAALPRFLEASEYPHWLVLVMGAAISSLAAGLLGMASLQRRSALRLVSQRTAALRAAVVRHEESEARLRAIVDHAHDAIIVIDRRGTVRDFNPGAERIFGWGLSDLVGRNINMLMPSPTREEHDGYLARYMDGGLPKIIGSGRVVRGLRKDGSEVLLDLAVSEMEVRGERLFCGIVRDITERAAAEEALRRSESKLRSYIEQTLDGVLVADPEGRYLETNPASARMLGYTEEELLRLSIQELVWPDPRDIEAAREHFGRVVAHGKSVGEVALRRKTGERIVADVHAVDLGGGRYLGIMRDVTERYLAEQALQGERALLEERVAQRTEVLSRTNAALQAEVAERRRAETQLTAAREEALQAAEAKAAFLANMSHEIRTPMNAVVGMAALLEETELDSEQRRYVQTIRTSGHALLATINDILDFSKVESGVIELEQHPFELGGCVEEAFEIVAPRAAEKGIEFVYDIDASIAAWIVGDPVRLRQILVNLLSNAVKFTERGEVSLVVKKAGNRPDAVPLRFEVRDTGIGIPEAHLDNLFRAFTQADSSTTRRFGGTGLGLAISSRLVQLMGGEIGVESEENKGSVFWFTLPAGIARGTLPSRYPNGPSTQLAGRRVLVVGGNRALLLSLQTQCARWGMEVAVASRGTHALVTLEAESAFDLVVLDQHLPGMDGLSLARAISVQCGERTPPLILLATQGARGADAQTMGLIAARLHKPFKHSQLHAVLASAVHGQTPVPPPSPMPRIDQTLAQRLPMRILVVEDSVINQRLTATMLRKFGYSSDLAGDGAEAVELASMNPYHLILMDLQMPVMDGLEATRRICAALPLAQRPRIVAMTANALPVDRQRCLDAGMDDYIAKPVLPSTLQSMLEKWAPQNAAERRLALDASVVDEAILDEIGSLDELGKPSMLRGLIQDYVRDVPDTLTRLGRDLERRDAAGVVRAVHKLGGVSASLGAVRMAELCRRIEQYAASGDLRPVPDLLAELQQVFERTRGELRKVL